MKRCYPWPLFDTRVHHKFNFIKETELSMRAKALVWGPFLNYLSKEVVFKLFIKGVCFYLHYAKGRGIIQQGVDMWHWAVVSKALCNRLLQLQWCNHFWTGYVNVCSVDAFGNVCCYSCSDATTLDFIFSRSLHSVLFNGRCYIVFLSSKDKMFLLGREPRLLKKKEN